LNQGARIPQRAPFSLSALHCPVMSRPAPRPVPGCWRLRRRSGMDAGHPYPPGTGREHHAARLPGLTLRRPVRDRNFVIQRLIFTPRPGRHRPPYTPYELR